MGKASSNKKVARVARTGGGRTAKGSSTSWFWPVFIGFVVVLGTAGIVYSKDQRQSDTTAPRPAENGKPQDHWHAAVGFYVCDKFMPSITDQADPTGIHSHGDGVVHIHPFSEVAAGRRATLGAFFQAVKATVNTSEIAIPGQETVKNGLKCGDQEAVIQTKTWANPNPDTPGTIVEGSPANIRPKDRELITVALVPKGTDIPRPESAAQLDKLTDVGPQPGAPGAPEAPHTAEPGAPPHTDEPPPADSTPPADAVPADSAPADTAPPDTAPAETPPSPPAP
ncbi:MAG: hypothetical protein ACR2HV_09635 [Acidimicrobiales bacterium]